MDDKSHLHGPAVNARLGISCVSEGKGNLGLDQEHSRVCSAPSPSGSISIDGSEQKNGAKHGRSSGQMEDPQIRASLDWHRLGLCGVGMTPKVLKSFFPSLCSQRMSLNV